MAADILNEEAIDLMAQFILGMSPTGPTLVFHLFVNNWEVGCTDILSDYTECTAPGYASQAADSAHWTGSTVSCVAGYTHPNLTFTFTGPGSPGQTIYGHWVGDVGTSRVFWAQSWATPYVIPAGGGSVVISPSWSDKQCT